MSTLRSLLVFVGLLAISSGVKAQEFKQRYVGKSSCAPDIQSEQPDFSIRLDKTQRTRLLYRDLSKVKIVAIIQYKDETDRCGVIRDVVEIKHVAKDFEFNCVDPQAPGDVIIGTSLRKGAVLPVTAIEAWKIDLRELKFIEIRRRVTCTMDSGDGEDDGSDLADQAKQRASQRGPGSNGRAAQP